MLKIKDTYIVFYYLLIEYPVPYPLVSFRCIPLPASTPYSLLKERLLLSMRIQVVHSKTLFYVFKLTLRRDKKSMRTFYSLLRIDKGFFKIEDFNTSLCLSFTYSNKEWLRRDKRSMRTFYPLQKPTHRKDITCKKPMHNLRSLSFTYSNKRYKKGYVQKPTHNLRYQP